MVTVWGRRSSSNVQAVMWCIAELGIPFKRIDAGFQYGVVDTPAYLAMNPNGTVPTLQDGDRTPIWESGAILRYLAASYADSTFWPDEPAERARVDQWAEWSKLNIALLFTSPVFWRVARTPVSRQNPEAIAQAVAEFEAKLAIADQQLQAEDFLAGRHFTLADIQFAHVLYRYYDIAIPRRRLDAVAAYYDRIRHRPAYQQHVAIAYDELVDTK